MKCPFCNNILNLKKIISYIDDEYNIGCSNCGAIGAIYRRKEK